VYRSAFFAAVWVVLAVLSWRAGIPAWLPFGAFAIYNAYRVLRPKPQATMAPSPEFPGGAPLGELGRYTVDGDESVGLFLELGKARVFVDLREDEMLERRKAQALALAGNVGALEASLVRFLAKNPEFKERRVSYIGLHAPNVQHGEVFWEPNGHTILKEFEFVET
jgi:hypothetical protein